MDDSKFKEIMAKDQADCTNEELVHVIQCQHDDLAFLFKRNADLINTALMLLATLETTQTAANHLEAQELKETLQGVFTAKAEKLSEIKSIIIKWFEEIPDEWKKEIKPLARNL